MIASDELTRICSRIFDGADFDFYGAGLSAIFERVAQTLLNKQRPGYWYDGVINPVISSIDDQSVEFTGDMWVGDVNNVRTQWVEPFRSVVSRGRTDTQCFEICLSVGDYTITCLLSDL